MKLQLEIEIGNDAMLTADDLARALKSVGKRVQNIFDGGEPLDGEFPISPMAIRDDNGNRIGEWEMS